MDRGGFSAVVSNPPFIGGKKVSGALGADFREYLKQHIANGKPGNADLCSYFLLRDLSVARQGRVGIIATNTIAQGDTREVGLDQAVDMHWSIYRAEKSQRWPGTASLEVALLWTAHPGTREARILDGNLVTGITPSLDPWSKVRGKPNRLAENAGRSYQGSVILGVGFIVASESAQNMVAEDPRNSMVLSPFLNGEDLNSRWDFSASRWVINFHDWPMERAKQYADCYGIVVDKVKPLREKSNRKVYRDRWWQFAERQPALQRAIAHLDRVLVFAQTSRTQMPALVSARQVLSQALVVITTDEVSALALHTSNFQYLWTAQHSSGMRTDLRFVPTDCFETFPQPRPTARMTQAGDELDDFRRNVMKHRLVGLTPLYNLVHSQTASDMDISRLRGIHVEIDEAVREAYAQDEERDPQIKGYEASVASAKLPSWRTIDLGHGFHETQQGVRFTISPQARVDVLDKLLALNQYRYDQEIKQGLHSGKGHGTSRRRTTRASSGADPEFDDDGIFSSDGTLF